jgi:hypothetical protein
MSEPETCLGCGRRMERGVACTIDELGGNRRVPYGLEADDWGAASGAPCHDCNVLPGQLTTDSVTWPAVPTAVARNTKGRVTPFEADLAKALNGARRRGSPSPASVGPWDVRQRRRASRTNSAASVWSVHSSIGQRTSLRGLLLCCGWRRGLRPQCVGGRRGARESRPTRTGARGRSASRVATLWKRYANASMTISSASGRGGRRTSQVPGAWNGRSEGAKLRLRASGAGRRRLASRRPKGCM